MIELAIVLLIVAVAAVFAGRKLFKSVARKESPCACEPASAPNGQPCSQCPMAGEQCTPPEADETTAPSKRVRT